MASRNPNSSSAPQPPTPSASPMSRRMLVSMAIAALVLLVGGVSLRAWVAQEGWVLHKKEAPPARELTEMPQSLGRGFRYKLAREEPRLSEDVEKELGTSRYISWVYEDTQKEKDKPGRFLRIHIPYYTGTTDPVPHVSDRCHVAAGAELVGRDSDRLLKPDMMIRERSERGVEVMTVNGDVWLPAEQIPVVINEFHDPRRNETYFVTYFFIANNVFVGDRHGVRMNAFDLTNEYAYYAKVEITPLGVKDKEAALAATEEFLAAALPEIMRCMPDWDALHNRKPAERVDPLRVSNQPNDAPSARDALAGR